MKARNQCGFSLIELLVAMAVVGIAATAIFSVFESSSRSATMQNAAAGAQQSVRAALEMMVQDIRMAGYDPENTANAGIEVLQSDQIRITSDRDELGSIDHDFFERISYRFNNFELQRKLYDHPDNPKQDKQTWQPVISNVTDLVFTPVNINGKLVAVEILLTVEESAGRNTTVSRTLSTTVHFRNL